MSRSWFTTAGVFALILLSGAVWWANRKPQLVSPPKPRGIPMAGIPAQTATEFLPPASPDPESEATSETLPEATDPWTPEQETAQRAKDAITQRRNFSSWYAAWMAEAGVSEKEREALLTMIIDYHNRDMAAREDLTLDSATRVQIAKIIEAERQKEMARMLGVQRRDSLLEFERAAYARLVAGRTANILEMAGMPLTSDQRGQLIQAAIRSGIEMPSMGDQRSGAENHEAELQILGAQVDRNDQRLLRAAQGILTAEQFQALQADVLEWQARRNAPSSPASE